MRTYDIIVIGAGPAGLSAAVAAGRAGINDILIIDRDESLGGILNQCIHDGFGIKDFKKNLTGTEYAEKLIEETEKLNILSMTNTSVLNIDEDKVITALNKEMGIFKIKAKALIYSTGAREVASSNINTYRKKFAGIYSAGTVQRFVNVEGYMPGKKVVILGSNNIALITAGRLTIEGIKVEAIVEPKDKVQGSNENFKKWVQMFNIPVMLECDIESVEGKARIEAVNICSSGGDNKLINCDSLIVSSKLMPENRLIEKFKKAYVDGIFVCGNALHINESAEEVSYEGTKAGTEAANYIRTV